MPSRHLVFHKSRVASSRRHSSQKKRCISMLLRSVSGELVSILLGRSYSPHSELKVMTDSLLCKGSHRLRGNGKRGTFAKAVPSVQYVEIMHGGYFVTIRYFFHSEAKNCFHIRNFNDQLCNCAQETLYL